ncbi:winged helix-turn-helix transcriptional regulator [Solirubrobacter sp. CPCC 204708]|uniref:MarR family winged helix-turn-helix transcriptional regulator n=1 Tax=Solirubrobacter deserti TaxID=2282478 RepID=UPI002AFA6A0F|nr:winged helix-turn-helix transcriptional regulator [Solirubrobacter deserti]
MSALPVIDQPARRVGALLEHVNRQLRQHSVPALETLGVRPRHVLALTVLRDTGGSSQADLAGLLQMDRTNLVGLLNELETEGWVERRRSPEDRRRHLVELTAAGGELLSRIDFALAAIEDHVLSALDAAQREQLYELLRQAANLEAACTESPDC